MWVGKDNTGIFTITPGAASGASTVVPTWAASTTVSDIKIIGASWANGPVTFASVITNMYTSYKANSLWSWNTPTMVTSYDYDTWPGVSKSGVIFYRNTRTNALMFITGREWSTGTWLRAS